MSRPKGFHHSPETRAKIAASTRRHFEDPANRAAQREASLRMWRVNGGHKALP